MVLVYFVAIILSGWVGYIIGVKRGFKKGYLLVSQKVIDNKYKKTEQIIELRLNNQISLKN